jgi:hypothetical protein
MEGSSNKHCRRKKHMWTGKMLIKETREEEGKVHRNNNNRKEYVIQVYVKRMISRSMQEREVEERGM